MHDSDMPKYSKIKACMIFSRIIKACMIDNLGDLGNLGNLGDLGDLGNLGYLACLIGWMRYTEVNMPSMPI